MPSPIEPAMPCPDDPSSTPAGLIRLRNLAGDSAVINLYGGQLLSWRTANGGERLYCSQMLPTKPGGPTRGGVPICFPQFADRGPLPKHGLVRTTVWHTDSVSTIHAEEVARAHLWLAASDVTRALWPHEFELQLDIALGTNTLEVGLTVSNQGTSAFSFTGALHTYLASEDVRQLSVSGLQDVHYIDSAQGQIHATQSDTLLRITEETDRIYLSPAATLQLQSTVTQRALLQVEQEGFCDSVVWNPGPIKAEQLGDMVPADWIRMLCIEAAQVAQPVHLAPQAQWRGVQRLRVLAD